MVFSYNPEYVAKIKTVNAHRWHPEEKYWSFPCSKPVLKEILSSFAGEQIDIDPSLQTLLSQNQRERSVDHRTWAAGYHRLSWAVIPCLTRNPGLFSPAKGIITNQGGGNRKKEAGRGNQFR